MNTRSLPFAVLACAVTSMSPLVAQQQGTPPAAVDNPAILVLDRMSDMIGSLSSVSYTLTVVHDVTDPEYGTIARLATHRVYMTGPDRMHVNSVSEGGRRGYWYNGQQVVYYNFAENNYGVMDAPDNILDAIEEVHQRYGVDFPAADFFYPAFTDDLIAQSTRIDYLGTVQVDGRECFRIVAHGADQTVQLWIANDATFLPMKFIITDHTRGNAQYQGTFTDWVVNPDLPDQLYEFSPPPGASPVRILPKDVPPTTEKQP
jgi:hypothetical protein